MLKHSKISKAVYCAILGLPISQVAHSEDASKKNALEEIVVTATRRESSIKEVPYSISAYSGDSLADAGVTDFSGLARSIPGLTLSDVGRGKNGISSGIIMRGLNLTGGAAEDFAMVTDPVVSIYLGETPLFANLELRDMERIEVLKGPQSTLYGSGSLGGTMRYIPNKPEFDAISGSVQTKLSATDGAGDLNHDLEFVFNLPLSDTFALRASVVQLENAGYIDSDYIVGLDENQQPTGEYSSAEDINDEEVAMARLAARWAPSERTDIVLTLNHQSDDVQGSSASSEGLEGYNTAAKLIEEFERETDLASLVVTHDLGFAELVSATSFTSNSAESKYDQSYNYGFSTWWGPYYVSYYGYTGGISPAAEVIIGEKTYETDTITQEFRLAGSVGKFDWLGGAFFNKQNFEAEAYDYVYGLDAAFNITNPMAADLGYANFQNTEFEDKAVFGELTYHIMDSLSVTAGLRYFQQTFDAKQEVLLPACQEFWYTQLGFFSCGDAEYNDTDARGYAAGEDEKEFDDLLYRFNVSYHMNEDTNLYFNVSQGFRHGGANGLPTTGIFAESDEYLFFDPDKSTNYETGVKGTAFDSALYFSAAAFYIDWEDPILLVQSPAGGFPAMINAQSAVSKGLELEVNANLSERVKVNAGYTYVEAELTEDFITPGDTFGGAEGETLPGVPESTLVASLEYSVDFGEVYMNARLGVSYKDKITMGYQEPSIFSETGYDEIPASTLWNTHVNFTFDQWTLNFFVDNLLNADDPTASDGDGKYITEGDEVKAGEQYAISQLGDQLYRVRPRTAGLSVKYRF